MGDESLIFLRFEVLEWYCLNIDWQFDIYIKVMLSLLLFFVIFEEIVLSNDIILDGK